MDRYDWGRARRGYWAGKLRIGDPERRRLLDPDLVAAISGLEIGERRVEARGEEREADAG